MTVTNLGWTKRGVFETANLLHSKVVVILALQTNPQLLRECMSTPSLQPFVLGSITFPVLQFFLLHFPLSD